MSLLIKSLVCAGLLINGFINVAYAQRLSIGLEPFPPFVDEQGQGLTIDMLREIESRSAFTFDVKIMTYARAKHELKNDRLEIAGHTPKGLETDSFYQYAIELDWQIDTTSDLFSFDPKFFEPQNIVKGRIGTTTGNAVFFAEITGIDQNKFIEVSTLNQLVDMLVRGRIDVLLFERASVMTLLEQQSVPTVYYQSIGHVPASIAVANTEQGMRLKEALDAIIKKLDKAALFSSYLKYTQLPDKGIMPAKL